MKRDPVHLWRIDLASCTAGESALVLAPGELERAARFVFDRDRARYLTAHVALRRILARYLRIEAREVPIVVEPQGKPVLRDRGDLNFSLSHSQDLALVGIDRQRAIGVDIEVAALPRDARNFPIFTPREREALRAIPDEALAIPFFAGWTKKEACLKATGTGLAVDPATVEVGLDTSRVRVDLPGGVWVEAGTAFQGPQCVASLAVAGGFSSFELFHFDTSDARAESRS